MVKMDKSIWDALYNVNFSNFLLHDLQCIGWGDLAKRLRGAGCGVFMQAPLISRKPV